jgi:hypothetical protein
MQGGDLIKWDKAKVGYYVGVDIAEGSVSFLSHETLILCVHLYKYTKSLEDLMKLIHNNLF